jgi:GT2 family glycosyltransferase
VTGATPFGSGTESLAGSLGTLPVLVIAPDAIPEGYLLAAEARRAGEEFGLMFLTADVRGANAYDAARQVAQRGDYDEQRIVFDAIITGNLNIGDGRKLSEFNEPQTMLRVALADLCRLADTVVTRSWREAERQRQWAGYAHPNTVRWYPSRELGSWEPAAHRDLVVVWAPDYPADRTAMHTFSLHDLHAETVVISQGGAGASSRARYVDVASKEVPALLARALCIVDVALDDPSWTQAFAARGLSVAAAATSGADEVADGLALYYPWSYRSIWAATLEALGRPHSTARETPPTKDSILRSLESSRPERPAREPLVSIVIPTYNRREDLTRILRKLQAQTYGNFEVVVVNDGGESIAYIAELDARFRPIDRAENVGPFRATNFGLGAARGEYIQIGADDDEWYPDHLIRLVEALERTGAAVAHSNALIRFESEKQTTGYNCSIFCESLDHTSVLASSPVAGNAYMFRRDALDRVGTLDETFLLADQEIQIRLAEISDFVHVPHVTAEWLVRESGQLSQNKQKDVPEDMRRVFARHPAPGRSYVEMLRANAIQNVLSRPKGTPFRPVVSRVQPKL